MQLTRHTDFALRLLIYLDAAAGRRVTIAEVAREQDIPRSHLMKIANDLAHAGFIAATRGRGGGIGLSRASAEIRIGDVIRAMEPACDLVNCDGCRLLRGCTLPRHLNRAIAAFHAVMNEQSLADITRPAAAS